MTKGTWNRYFCRKCPYEAFVSGGDDVGMAAEKATGKAMRKLFK